LKVIYDTCIYIDYLRAAMRSELFEHQGHIRYLAPIVVMELNAGARSSTQQKALDRLYAPYARAGRVLPLSSDSYHLAGRVLAKLRGKRESHLIANDILIALSALQVGACLYTANARDFELIAKYIDFRWAKV
jgi:predicted nucleic acid-binding protein